MQKIVTKYINDKNTSNGYPEEHFVEELDGGWKVLSFSFTVATSFNPTNQGRDPDDETPTGYASGWLTVLMEHADIE